MISFRSSAREMLGTAQYSYAQIDCNESAGHRYEA